MCKLTSIQNKVRANKALFNKFGGFSYRNVEMICEAVKPILAEYNCNLILTDEIVMIGTRYYVKATARLFDGERSFESVAYAREADVKKGMDEAQITGSASSYARKYALGGLFLLDDNKDIDSIESHEKPSAPQVVRNGGENLALKLTTFLKEHCGGSNAEIGEYMKLLNIKSTDTQELQLLLDDVASLKISFLDFKDKRGAK